MWQHEVYLTALTESSLVLQPQSKHHLIFWEVSWGVYLIWLREAPPKDLSGKNYGTHLLHIENTSEFRPSPSQGIRPSLPLAFSFHRRPSSTWTRLHLRRCLDLWPRTPHRRRGSESGVAFEYAFSKRPRTQPPECSVERAIGLQKNDNIDMK